MDCTIHTTHSRTWIERKGKPISTIVMDRARGLCMRLGLSVVVPSPIRSVWNSPGTLVGVCNVYSIHGRGGGRQCLLHYSVKCFSDSVSPSLCSWDQNIVSSLVLEVGHRISNISWKTVVCILPWLGTKLTLLCFCNWEVSFFEDMYAFSMKMILRSGNTCFMGNFIFVNWTATWKVYNAFTTQAHSLIISPLYYWEVIVGSQCDQNNMTPSSHKADCLNYMSV